MSTTLEKVAEYRRQGKDDKTVKNALMFFDHLKSAEADAALAEANAIGVTPTVVAEGLTEDEHALDDLFGGPAPTESSVPAAPVLSTPAGPAEPKPELSPIAPPAVATATPQENPSGRVQIAAAEEPSLLTQQESIELVKKWVTEDADYNLPERRTFEEMVEELRYIREYRETLPDAENTTTTLSISQLEEIVRTYAPDAPHRATTISSAPHHPPELTPLVESGVARFEHNRWFVNRCYECGQFKNVCCGRILLVSAVRDDGTFTDYGRQATGLSPIRPPAPPKSKDQIFQEKMADIQKEPWWFEFRGLSELEGTGDIKMYIENFLPEGITLLCGLYKEGKSFLALSIAKALTSGKPLFERPGYEVPEIVPVLYLAAESGDGELKMRCKKFGITEDKTLFLTRTLSKGPMLELDDSNLESLVKAMKPIIILETLIRFSDGDEDSASDNRQLAHHIFRLIGLGARAVTVIHHSIKDLNKSNPTQGEAARGSGDILAMADVTWLIMQDNRLYQGGKGPNEIDLVGWGRDFNPVPLRLALTKKAPKNLPAGTITYAPGIISCIDSSGNFEWVDKLAQETKKLEFGQELERLIAEDPSLNLKELSQKTGRSKWEISKALKKLGYRRPRGGKSGETSWLKQ